MNIIVKIGPALALALLASAALAQTEVCAHTTKESREACKAAQSADAQCLIFESADAARIRDVINATPPVSALDFDTLLVIQRPAYVLAIMAKGECASHSVTISRAEWDKLRADVDAAKGV